jgi:hypothetical protein
MTFMFINVLYLCSLMDVCLFCTLWVREVQEYRLSYVHTHIYIYIYLIQQQTIKD